MLDNAAASDGTVELANLMNLFAFDAIGRITTSHDFGALRGDEIPAKFLDAVKDALRYFAIMGDFPEWHWCLFSITQHLGAMNGLVLANRFIQMQIQHHLLYGPGKESSSDMISDFMPQALSEPDLETVHHRLRHLCETNILPGADTTATAICAVLFFLSQNPSSAGKLRKELQEFLDPDQAKHRESGKLCSLPYLQAVVKEAMRLHPPVGLMNPRVVPVGGATICGRYFAGGVSQTVCIESEA